MAAELFSKANEEFVSENYQRAIELYSEAIQAEDDRDDFYVNRAQAYLKLEKYTEAYNDCSKACTIKPKNVKAHLRKGIALFHLKDYKNAIDAFREGQSLDSADSSYAKWLEKCEAELPPLSSSSTEQASSAPTEPTEEPSTQPTAQTPSDSTTEPPTMPPAEPVKMPSGPKTKHDWYQTATHVIVTILIKNVAKEDFTADIQEHTVSVSIRQGSGTDYSLELDLAHPIVPAQSNYKVMSTKVEIKLKKEEGIQWTKLEGEGQPKEPTAYMAAPVATAPTTSQYPSSSTVSRDWDKLALEVAEEEKTEKKEGDAALNSLFQQIYSDGTDDVKRAMLKSFYESGGTVLSTNWTEVGKDKVDVKPPDGLEWKKY
ncbi:protein SGT1 homolog [Haliotis rufescens]|uniref:protein SGT1 homolog n=1 Tax=Haliotis rufescens TaxID=6454 RepID=UPI00201F119F|nr:protein SGT1 homolog [Haliotis rufescens]